MSLNGLKWLKDKPIIYYIDNNIYISASLAKIPQHESAGVICQCGAILNTKNRYDSYDSYNFTTRQL